MLGIWTKFSPFDQFHCMYHAPHSKQSPSRSI